MTEYKVVWEIDIDADSPEEAAREALKIQRDSCSIATVFKVISKDEDTKIIDLTYDIEYCAMCERNEVDYNNPVVEGIGKICRNCFNRYVKEKYGE